MKMMKRGFALLLCAVLVVGMLPVRAMAEDVTSPVFPAGGFTFEVMNLKKNDVLHEEPKVYKLGSDPAVTNKGGGNYELRYFCAINGANGFTYNLDAATDGPMVVEFTWNDCTSALEQTVSMSKQNGEETFAWDVKITRAASSGHQLSEAVKTAGTCTAKSRLHDVCANCAHTENERDGEVSHNWGEWTPHDIQKGTHFRSCSSCDVAPETGTCSFAGELCTSKCETCNADRNPDGHELEYGKTENKLIQKCKACPHEAAAELKKPEEAIYYTGSAVTPLTVDCSENWCGSEPEVSYSKNTDVSTETEKASGSIAAGEVTVTMEFDILPGIIDPKAKGYQGSYDGKDHGVTFEGVIPSGAEVTYSTEETGTYTETPITYKNAGTDVTVWYKIEKRNYVTVSGSVPIVIEAVSLNGMTKEYTGEYNGQVHTPELKIGDTVLAEGTDYTREAWSGNLTDAGEYTTEITGKGNYEGTVPVTYTINKAAPTKDLFVVTLPEDAVYEKDKTHEATVAVKDGVKGLGDVTVRYNGETGAPEAAGEYAVTVDVAAGDNYTAVNGLSLGSFVIAGMEQDAPAAANLKPTDETVFGKKDGRIEISEEEDKKNLQYKQGESGTYAAVSQNVLENLEPGVYYFRNQANGNYADSEEVTVEIKAGPKLTVEVPDTQDGYTLEADKDGYTYNEAAVLTLTVAEGYTLSDTFEMTVKIGETETKYEKDDLTYNSTDKTYTRAIGNLTENAEVTEVKGIADVTKPQLRVTVSVDPDPDENDDDEVFTSLMESGVAFTDYKGMHTLITVADTTGAGSELTVLYLESDRALTKAQLDDTEDEAWDTYAAGGIQPNGDGNKIFYFKAVDKAGNESEYVSTDGFIYDGTAPSLSLGTGVKTFGITRRVTIEDANLLSINIDGTDQKIEDSEGNDRTKITYRITRNTSTDKAKTYEFVVKDKAGNVSEATYTVEPLVFDEKAVTKSWSQGSTKTADFKVKAVLGDYDDVDDYDMKFQVKIDSKVIDEKNYTIEPAEDGSGTVVKLKTTYLKTLKAAKHKIQVSVIAKKTSTTTETLDSTEVYEFSVSNNPKTGDAMNLPFWGGMAMVSLLCGAAMILSLRKKEQV